MVLSSQIGEFEIYCFKFLNTNVHRLESLNSYRLNSSTQSLILDLQLPVQLVPITTKVDINIFY